MTIKLPAAVLGYIRAQTNSLMTDTCTIEQNVQSKGEYGEAVNAWVVVSSDVSCRLITVGNRFRERAGEGSAVRSGRMDEVPLAREYLIDSYRLIVPVGTSLDVDYRATMSNGDVYHVVDLVTERTDETDLQAVVTKAR